jgi:hypothetical protein
VPRRSELGVAILTDPERPVLLVDRGLVTVCRAFDCGERKQAGDIMLVMTLRFVT